MLRPEKTFKIIKPNHQADVMFLEQPTAVPTAVIIKCSAAVRGILDPVKDILSLDRSK